MKKIKNLILIMAFMLFTPKVLAGSFSISSSSTSISVGSNVTVYVSASDAVGRFSASSSDSSVLAFNDDASSVFLDNNSSSFRFLAKKAGSATITITPSDCAGYDEKEITGSKSITITVNSGSNGGTSSSTTTNKPTTVGDSNTAKSSINYLSSLSVEGFELSPAFDKDTTEYDVNLPNGTTNIKVNGEKESSVSYVTGLGEAQVSEGANFISVVVTAENGAKRTYNIRATVEEESPVVVNVDNKDLTLIRKAESMPSASEYYTLGKIKINDIEIPAYTSEITGYTLVALKNESGNIELYKYENNTYTLYKEYGFNSIKLSLIEPSSIPKGYTEGKVKIDEKEVKAYTKEGSLPLIYGMNVETGETNFYSYDETENTIQKFKNDESKKDKSKYYPYIIIGLVGLSLFELLIIICVNVSKNKKLKKALRNKLDSKTEYETSFETKRNEVYKDETNITDDLTDEYMSTDETLGHTAMISSSVNNVFDNSVNRKELKKKSKKKNKDDDDMYKF